MTLEEQKLPIVKRNYIRLKNLLSQEQTHILDTALLLMLPALLTKISGQFFNLIVASFYGANDSRINQFFIANTIPELLTTVLMVGAVGTVIIPVLVSCKLKEGEKQFHRVYSSVLNTSVLTFSIVAFLIILFADKVVPAAIDIVNPIIPPNQAELSNIIMMMRALIVPQLILGISVFITSGLNVYDRILLPQISPLLYNVGRLVCLFTFLPILDYSPWALVAGVYVGSLLHLLIQIPLFRYLRIKYYLVIDFKDIYLKQILKLGLPRIIVLASDQIGLAINSVIAFAFVGGAASLNYSKSLYLVIPSMFGYTFVSASYPTIARLFVEQNYEKIKEIINKTLNEIFFLSIPFVVTLMVLRVPIVRLLFGIFPDTQFSLDNTYQVAWILLGFSFGLVFITSRWFVFSLFYAAKDTLTPSIISIVSLISVVGLSILFSNFLSHNQNYAISTIDWDLSNFTNRSTSSVGVGGISLAMSVVYTVEFFILMIAFHTRKLKLDLKKLVGQLQKKFLAGGIMLLVMYFTYKVWNVLSYSLPESAGRGFTGSTTLNLMFLTIVTIVQSFLVYYLLCHLFRVEELKILRKYLNPLFKLGGLKIK